MSCVAASLWSCVEESKVAKMDVDVDVEVNVDVDVRREREWHTVLQSPSPPCTPGFLADETLPLCSPPRPPLLFLLRLMSLPLRLLPCCSRRCCVSIVGSLWLMCLSIILLVVPGQRLCGRPWGRARLKAGLDMCCLGAKMWGRCRRLVCRWRVALASPW